MLQERHEVTQLNRSPGFQSLLARPGHELIQQRSMLLILIAACSTAEAVDVLAGAANGSRPDVLVSDIGMPGEDGIDLITRVRALGPERGGNIPAIALTAYARAEDRARVLAAGYHRHIAKPVEPAVLAAVVAVLARRTAVAS